MKLVVVGGGHGAAASLQAALAITNHVAGIITVADDGGSSGRLARQVSVLPMGDIRNCLTATADHRAAAKLFQHRFSSGKLAGHVAGNLWIAEMASKCGFLVAVEEAGRVLGSRARIVPPTLQPVRLVAELESGTVSGQVNVAVSAQRIRKVRLEPSDAKAYEGAVDLLFNADVIVLGPGSLFTSVLPPLLVSELKRAFVESTGRKVYVMNLVAPPGETAEFDGTAHISALHEHLGEASIDVVIAHEGRTPLTNSPAVHLDVGSIETSGAKVLTADLLPESRVPRHEPQALAKSFEKI